MRYYLKPVVYLIAFFYFQCANAQSEKNNFETLVLDTAIKLLVNNYDNLPIINFKECKLSKKKKIYYGVSSVDYQLEQLKDDRQAREDSLFISDSIIAKYKIKFRTTDSLVKKIDLIKLNDFNSFEKKAKECETYIWLNRPVEYENNYYVRVGIRTKNSLHHSIVFLKFDLDLRLRGFSQSAGLM